MSTFGPFNVLTEDVWPCYVHSVPGEGERQLLRGIEALGMEQSWQDALVQLRAFFEAENSDLSEGKTRWLLSVI